MQRDGNRITVSGNLTLATATQAAGEMFSDGLHLVRGDKMVVDLSGVEAVDSSAVSVLLQWLRLARERGIELAFVNLPDNLCSLAKLYDVAEVLPISL